VVQVVVIVGVIYVSILYSHLPAINNFLSYKRAVFPAVRKEPGGRLEQSWKHGPSLSKIGAEWLVSTSSS
jgi:hypothetical protein